MRVALAIAIVGVALGGCELRGEKQDKGMYGKTSAKTAKPKPKTAVTPPAAPKVTTRKKDVTRQNTRRPPALPRTGVKPGEIKWEPYTVKKIGLSFDSFGAKSVRAIDRGSPYVVTSLTPLNAIIFYSGKHTYETEMKRYEKRPKTNLSRELTVKVCGKNAKRREINMGGLTAVMTGFKHRNTDMLSVWRVPTALRAKYAAAEARFHKSIKCK